MGMAVVGVKAGVGRGVEVDGRSTVGVGDGSDVTVGIDGVAVQAVISSPVRKSHIR